MKRLPTIGMAVLLVGISVVLGGCQRKSAEGQSCAKTADCDDGMVCLKQVCCQPDCDGKECGSDGCDGTCGKCDDCGTGCVAGKCKYTACDGKECGDDGCGGSCGKCPTGRQCGGDDHCFNPCSGKECGDDGYGNSCGSCSQGAPCQDSKCQHPYWTDPRSGLTWQDTPTGGTMNWSEAKAHCAGLSLDGGGWHLPTKDELESLIRGCNYGCSKDKGPAKGCYWPDEMQGSCSWYWSSSPVEGGDIDDIDAWVVNFANGGVYYIGVDNDRRVRCVRDAP